MWFFYSVPLYAHAFSNGFFYLIRLCRKSLPRQEPACAPFCCLTIHQRKHAVDPDAVNSDARSCGVIPRSSVAYRCRIEEHEVCGVALADETSIVQTDGVGRQASHLMHGRWQVEDLLLAAKVAKYAGESTPQPGVRTRIVRQTVAAHHHRGMLQHSLHIVQ